MAYRHIKFYAYIIKLVDCEYIYNILDFNNPPGKEIYEYFLIMYNILEDKDRSFLIQKTKHINSMNREKKMLLINRKIRTAGLVLAVAGAAAAVTTMAAANLAIAASVAVKKAILENTKDMTESAEAEMTVADSAETKI